MSRSVRCRSAASIGPPARTPSPSSRRASRAVGERSRSRAAASSSARGSPSRRRQMAPTVGASAPSRTSARPVARARSMKRATEGTSARSSRTASVPGTGSGSTRRICSARRLRGTRLVTSRRSPGQPASSSASGSAAAGRSCSRLSSRSRRSVPPMCRTRRSSGPSLPLARRPRPRDGGGHQRGIAQGRQLGDMHLAVGTRDLSVDGLERETGLAAAARPHERHEPRARQEPGQGLELPLPAHERGEAGTQHRWPPLCALRDHGPSPKVRPERHECPDRTTRRAGPCGPK